LNGLRRFLSVILYVAMAFPLMLGGMALISVKPLVSDPASTKTLFPEDRLLAVLESPTIASLAPESITLGGQTLDGKAFLTAWQSTIPARLIISTTHDAIDSARSAFGSGQAYFQINAQPLSSALEAGAETFAETYVATLKAAGRDTAKVTTQASAEDIATLIAAAAAGQPESWSIGEAGSRFEFPTRMGRLGAGLTGASLWLLFTGAGLCFASVMISNDDWRRRLGMLGSRILVPSTIILVIGLGPRLIMPGGKFLLPNDIDTIQFPELLTYLKFLGSKLTEGFLVTGLVGLGVGTALATVKRVLPLAIEEDMD
jgi:hypothetical protein